MGHIHVKLSVGNDALNEAFVKAAKINFGVKDVNFVKGTPGHHRVVLTDDKYARDVMYALTKIPNVDIPSLKKA